MSNYPMVKISDVSTYRKDFIKIDDNVEYKRCRVQLHKKGVVLRDLVKGNLIKTKSQRLCKKEDFIVAEMDAKFGGYGIIPKDLEGAVVSSHYYLYELDKTKILPDYLEVLIDTDVIQKQIKAQGSTNYSRVSPSEVLDFEIPCPSLKEQKRIIEFYLNSKKTVQSLNTQSSAQSTYLSLLRQSILQEAIEGKLTAQWRLPAGRQERNRSEVVVSNHSGKIIPKIDGHYLYVLECDDKSLYKGFTSNLYKRISEHIKGIGADWTQTHCPVSLIHFEEFQTEREAVEREKYLKSGIGREWLKEIQKQKDEDYMPASMLLEKIKREKEAHLPAGRQAKKEKELPPIKSDEMPFKLPLGWVWTRLGEISKVFAGYSFNSYDFKSDLGVKCIKITNAGVQQLIESDERLPLNFINKYKDFAVKTDDLIIALTRPYISTGLKISRCPESFNNSLLNQRVAAIRNVYNVNWNYIYRFMTSDFVLKGYKEKFEKINLQPNLKMSDVTDLNIPLPPLAEQRTIVERVDKLLSMVDELEKQVSGRKVQAEELMQAVLREAFEG